MQGSVFSAENEEIWEGQNMEGFELQAEDLK